MDAIVSNYRKAHKYPTFNDSLYDLYLKDLYKQTTGK